jgi:radical SAM superfamily enzyme YgiQ (UPF0313 family)
MNEKVLLIRPQNVYRYNNYPPLNLICIGSALETAGFDVEIINAAFERDPPKAIDAALQNALFVGLTLITSEVPNAYEILKHIHEHSDVPVVVGGWHCTLFPDQMAECEYVDYVVAGEGEDHILAIAKALRDGRTPDKTVFHKEILDIEKLAAPDYDLDGNIEAFVTSYLTDKLSQRVPQPMRWLPYESSRGCPSRCTFCINIVTDNRRYRKKSPEKVLADLDRIVTRYRLTHVKFIDDNFFVDIERVRQISRGLIDRDLQITWDAECRCDYFNDRMINDQTLQLAKESGLVQLTLGIESGSQNSLDLMKKGITPQQGEFAVAQCDRYGITARSSFMLEIPGETLWDIKQTVSFINRLRKYKHFTCGVNTFRPYPRCELTQKLVADGRLAEPADFEGWTDRSIVDMYTSAEYSMPWQVSPRTSRRICLYLNTESAIRLGNHQIDRRIDRIINSTFIFLAKIRNRLKFYWFPLDNWLYTKFFAAFYRRRQKLEKAGAPSGLKAAMAGANQ